RLCPRYHLITYRGPPPGIAAEAATGGRAASRALASAATARAARTVERARSVKIAHNRPAASGTAARPSDLGGPLRVASVFLHAVLLQAATRQDFPNTT